MDTRSANNSTTGGRRKLLPTLLRWSLTLGILLAALAALAAALLMNRLDEIMRQQVEQHLAEQLPGMSVSVRSVRRVPGEGIEIRGVAIRDPAADADQNELVYIDELLAVCSSDLGDLLQGQLNLARLETRRVRLRAIRQTDGSWNLSKLLPLPQLGGSKPPALIEDATVEIQDLGNPKTGKFTLREVNLRVTPSTTKAQGSGTGTATESGSGDVETLVIEGSLVGEHFKRVSFRGQVDPLRGNWSTRGEIAELEMSSRLLAALPGLLSEQLAPLATLRARADLDFTLESPESGESVPRFVVSGRLTEGRFDDQRLPYPLTDLRADIYCDSQGLKIDNLQARNGRTSLELSFHCQGFQRGSPFVLRAKAHQLALDPRLYETLPEPLRRTWDDYALGGTVNVDLSVLFDGTNYEPDVVVECLNLTFSPCDFSYPMNSGRGTVRLRHKTLTTADFRARAGGQWIQFQGHVDNPGPQWTGWVQAKGEGAVTIDETLVGALDANGAKVLRSLRAGGTVSLVHARFERPQPGGPIEQDLELDLSNGTIEFEKFPYPIHSIQGKVLAHDGEWTFRDLVGRNDTAYIVCDGGWTPHQDVGGRLELEFDCRSVPLEDELRLALDSAGQQFWANLRPRGTVDQLGISLSYDSRRENLEVDVRGQQWPSQQNVAGRSLSVFPTYFPYRIDNLTGAVRYRDGVVEIANVRGRHGRTQIQLDGGFQKQRDGRWELRLSELAADGVQADHDLIAALPPSMGQALARLQLRGAINLRGAAQPEREATHPALVLRGGGAENASLQAFWNLTLDMENGHIGCGLDLEHVRGGIHLSGRLDETGVQNQGELAVDSMMVKGVHVTRVRGPLWVDQSRLLLGLPASNVPPVHPPRPITGQVFGGQLAIGGEASLREHGPFVLDVSLNEADLAEIARDLAPRQRRISGRVLANLSLRGNAQRTHTYQGSGFVRLRNADVYELPVMVALVKLLSVRRPDTTAFTSSDIDFRIQGEDIYFDPIDFRGDAISLIGKGWMDLSQNIRLTFYTQVGRREFPLLGSVLAEASRKILEIQVVGTLNEPVVQQTAFPELDDTLQMLFPDARRRDSNSTSWWNWPMAQRRPPAPSLTPPPTGVPR